MVKEKLFYLGNKALIQNNNSEVLLLHIRRNENEDYYDLPGGRVDKSEDIEAALAREVQEETGITGLKIEKHLNMALTSIQISISEEEKGGLILSVYVCSAGNLSNLVAEEGMKLEWCPETQVLEKIKQYPKELLNSIKAELKSYNDSTKVLST